MFYISLLKKNVTFFEQYTVSISYQLRFVHNILFLTLQNDMKISGPKHKRTLQYAQSSTQLHFGRHLKTGSLTVLQQLTHLILWLKKNSLMVFHRPECPELKLHLR